MPKASKRTTRDVEQPHPARPRVRTTTDAAEEEAAQRQGSVPTSDVSTNEDVWEDELDDNDEEEEIVDEGSEDDEYAEFQKESEAALTRNLKKITFAEDGAMKDDATEELMVWRNDPQYRASHAEDAGAAQDVTLEYANKAYDAFFQLRTEYPCLSFDVVRDQEGSDRTKYPLSMMLVCGTQAEEASKNQLVVLRISNLCRTKHDVESDEDSDESYIGDGGESDDAMEEEVVGDGTVNHGEPIVHHRTIPHHGSANRVRCCPQEERGDGGQLVAVWSDAGYVQVFDLNHDVRALADFANWSKEQAKAWRDAGKGRGGKRAALKFCTPSSAHKTEGYGLDWSLLRPYVFASGDCNGALQVWQPTEDGRWCSAASNTAAGAMSVEEIQWSPTQSEVFIGARAGGMVEVWDTRDMRRSRLAWRADDADVNVADWNCARPASHLLVTGADGGMVAVWDLRKLTPAEPIQRLRWHTKSITSVEFSLHNESVLAVTGDDGQCTLWDLSLERDPSEEQEVIGELFGRPDLTGIPDQLMFQHQGLSHAKEVHWHAQIPGMVITTDYEGLHLFRPMNWRSLMK